MTEDERQKLLDIYALLRDCGFSEEYYRKNVMVATIKLKALIDKGVEE